MENTKTQKITTPIAIIVVGVLIMIAILITNGGGSKATEDKTLSEQVGVNKDKFTECMKNTDLQALLGTLNAGAEKAMSGIPAEQRGTPYSVIIGKNGVKTDIRGAYTKEDVEKLIAEVTSGKVTTPYTSQIPEVTADDHIIGNINAPIVIVEYADLECPYCKKFTQTMKDVVAESNGNVAWVYRHFIVHQNALPKAAAAECVAKLKGNDAFWKYIDLVFGLIQTQEDTSSLNKL